MQVAGANGIGRVDIVESRFVGMKSRGVYETPGGTILLTARRALESITLDRGEGHLKDELMPRFARRLIKGPAVAVWEHLSVLCFTVSYDEASANACQA